MHPLGPGALVIGTGPHKDVHLAVAFGGRGRAPGHHRRPRDRSRPPASDGPGPRPRIGARLGHRGPGPLGGRTVPGAERAGRPASSRPARPTARAAARAARATPSMRRPRPAPCSPARPTDRRRIAPVRRRRGRDDPPPRGRARRRGEGPDAGEGRARGHQRSTRPRPLRERLVAVAGPMTSTRALAALRPGAIWSALASAEAARRALARRRRALDAGIKARDAALATRVRRRAPAPVAGPRHLHGHDGREARPPRRQPRAHPPAGRLRPAPRGVRPIAASSGQTTRHRLDRGGNRRADAALHQGGHPARAPPPGEHRPRP